MKDDRDIVGPMAYWIILILSIGTIICAMPNAINDFRQAKRSIIPYKAPDYIVEYIEEYKKEKLSTWLINTYFFGDRELADYTAYTQTVYRNKDK